MAFDGGFTKKAAEELCLAVDCHVDKIYQPTRDELVFLLRKKGLARRLLISARPGAARIHFTSSKPENPAVAPMFCMLARKYFSGARFTGVYQKGMERIMELLFETTNELGDRVCPRLICEMIANQTNIILVSDDGRIIDAVRRSDVESGQRLIQPGARYEYPAEQGKLDPLTTPAHELAAAILERSEFPLSKAVLSVVDGFSPLICREIAFRVCGDDLPAETVSEPQLLIAVISEIKANLLQNQKPVLLCRSDGSPADFTYTDITQYGNTMQQSVCESFGTLLDTFYERRERDARIRLAAADMLRIVNNARVRAQKRLAARREELKRCEDREQLRVFGELLKANLHMIENGSRFADVQNYYDADLSIIRIPLNPALSPSANAARYFKEYKKSYTAEQMLTALTAEDEREIVYLDSVLDCLSRSETSADLSEIRTELCEAGYLREKGETSHKKREISGFIEYQSAEGYRILVGKNNRQNDYITTRLAGKSDLWFHTKNMPGSHVVVFSGGGPVGDETLLQAAQLAARHSRAAGSSQVPVDYTPIKYVRKPNGAKPGMVIYTTNKTLFVTPLEDAR